MGECKDNACETDNSCHTDNSCDSGSEERCTIAEDLLCLAKSAKHELLKEKMKKLLEARIGKKLDKVAEVVVEAALACMQQKMAAKQACADYEQKLRDAFMS